MKIGIRVPSPEPAAHVDPAFVARTAEALGFESVWYPEHTIVPAQSSVEIPAIYAHFADPFMALARASAVTTRIKLGTGVTLLPERNPLVLAKEVATLDHFSRGRLLLGVGAGWIPEESAILGGDFAHRWRQTRESVQAMKALWTDDPAEFHGRHYDFAPVHCNPKPETKPHPPILIGGTGKRVIERVVAWADGWLPIAIEPAALERRGRDLERRAREAGRDPDEFGISMYGVAPRREVVKSYFDAGAERVVVKREAHAATEAAIAADLERIAEAVLR